MGPAEPWQTVHGFVWVCKCSEASGAARLLSSGAAGKEPASGCVFSSREMFFKNLR